MGKYNNLHYHKQPVVQKKPFLYHANNPAIQKKIFLLLNSKALTRSEIVEKLKLPRTTVYDNLLQLEQRHIVERYEYNNGKRGRPKVFWKISRTVATFKYMEMIASE